jgi:hypothetical protein
VIDDFYQQLPTEDIYKVIKNIEWELRNGSQPHNSIGRTETLRIKLKRYKEEIADRILMEEE